MSENQGCFVRQTLMSCFFIMIAVVICSIGSIVGVDIICHNDIEQSMLLYPGAEMVSDEGGFFRARGMGKSETMFTTPDSVTDVREWYRDQKLEFERQSYDETTQRNNAPRRLSTVDVIVTEADDGSQTLIMFSSECAFG